MEVLDRKRVYIFPSRAGGVFLGVIGLMLIGAINYDNALAYILAFLLVGLVFTAMLHTWRNLAGLGLAAVAVEPVFAGHPARFELLLADLSGRPRHGLLLRRLVPRSWQWWRGPGAGRTVESSTVEDSSTRIILEVPSEKRGWLTLGRVEIASRYPLGLLRAWAYLRDDTQCLVYPAPHGKLPIAGGASGHGDDGGHGEGLDDFAGLRTYAPGDSLRSIHWKASARGDQLLVKKLQGGSGIHWLRWSDTAALGDVEARLSQLAQWVVTLDARGERYGLDLPSLRLEPDSGPAQRGRALRALALWPAT